MIQDVEKDAKVRMHKSIDAFKLELSKIRTGRANPSLLDHVTVEYYGTEVPLSQVGNINVEDSRTLVVTPWEKNMVKPVEKAIMTSDLGLNPVTVGLVIRVPMPMLTEERRRDLTKVVRHESENAKVAVRNIRRDAMHELKELTKEKLVSEDDERRASERIQKLTDQCIEQIDGLVVAKEKDLMEV